MDHDRSNQDDQSITSLIRLASVGEPDSMDELYRLVEPDLRRMTSWISPGIRKAAQLQTTEIIDEGFMRLIQRSSDYWQDREHFFRIASLIVRDVAVDETRKRLTLKRGGARRQERAIALDGISGSESSVSSAIELGELTSALGGLRVLHPESSDVLWCHYAMKLDRAQTARLLGISVHSIDRHHLFAKTWLRAKLTGPAGKDAQGPSGSTNSTHTQIVARTRTHAHSSRSC